MTMRALPKGIVVALICFLIVVLDGFASAWSTSQNGNVRKSTISPTKMRSAEIEPVSCFDPSPNRISNDRHDEITRRKVLQNIALLSSSCLVWSTSTRPALATSELGGLIPVLQQARTQLVDQVPSLLESEQWDSIRTLLSRPPLSDCWSKSTPLLVKYASAIEGAGGDDLAALEAREDLTSHLRYLDMAVYNNVFNPIATQGKSGATQSLIDSYYNDPKREYKASVAALDELLSLAKDLK